MQIGHRYENSPICVSDGSPPTADEYSTYIPSSRPGSRAPHVWLQDGRSALDLFGKSFTLLVLANSDSSEISKITDAFGRRDAADCGEHPRDPEVFCIRTKLVLVRPDGHVGWRGESADDADVIVDTLRGAV